MTQPDDWLTVAADTIDPPQRKFVNDPVGWAKERINRFLWSGQVSIAESVRDHRHTAVHTCFDVGKSFTAATLACWWIDSHPPGEAFVVTSAPTFQQVRAILWREIKRAHHEGELPGYTNQTEWILNDELVAFGRKPSDYDLAAFQGIHARYVLVILDEASGIPKSLYDAAEGLIANEECRIVAIGNPDDPSSHFATICKPGSGWHVLHIGVQDSPNFTDEQIPEWIRPLLVSKTWVEERKHEWGEESPLYISKVLGLFPEDASDGVVPASAAAKCRIPKDLTDEQLLPIELGVDVGAGGDLTVIRERRGMKAGREWKNHSSDPEIVVGTVIQAIHATGATTVKVDVIGIGWGIAGWLESKRKEKVHDARIVKVNVGQASTRPDRFPKLRDQIWWEIGRELSQTEGWDLSEVDDATVSQLLAPKYAPDASGRIKVEAKDETIKRIGHSPDNADALLMAFYKGAGPVTFEIAEGEIDF